MTLTIEKLIEGMETHVETLVTGTWVMLTAQQAPYRTMVHILGPMADPPNNHVFLKDDDLPIEKFLEVVRDKMKEIGAVWASLSTITPCGNLMMVVETPTDTRSVSWATDGGKLHSRRALEGGPHLLFPKPN